MEDMECIDLDQYSDRWRALVSAVMNLYFLTYLLHGAQSFLRS